MVKLKCVINLGLRVALSSMYTNTHVHTQICMHTVTGCNLPGAYGWPGIPLHLSYTQTAQTQFTAPDRYTGTNFARHADGRVRNHTTEML